VLARESVAIEIAGRNRQVLATEGRNGIVEFDYLYRGLCGLANAHRAIALAGHLGAAVIAGYFWGEDLGDLNSSVYRGVENELDRIMKGEEAFWFNSRVLREVWWLPWGLCSQTPC
jgi:hypothetical protein